MLRKFGIVRIICFALLFIYIISICALAGNVNLVCTDIYGNRLIGVSKNEQIQIRITAEDAGDIINPAIYSAAYNDLTMIDIRSPECNFGGGNTFETVVTTPDEEFSNYKVFFHRKDTLMPYTSCFSLPYSKYSPIDISSVSNGRIFMDDSSVKTWDGGKEGGLFSKYDFIAYSNTLSSRFAIKKSSIDSLGKDGFLMHGDVPYIIPQMGSKEAISMKASETVTIPISKNVNKVKFLAVTERSSTAVGVLVKYTDGTEGYCENIPLKSGYMGANSSSDNFVCAPASYVAWYNSTEFSAFSTFSIFEYEIITDADKTVEDIVLSCINYPCNILAVTTEEWNNTDIINYIEQTLKNEQLIKQDYHLYEQLMYLAGTLSDEERASVDGIDKLFDIVPLSKNIYVDSNANTAVADGSIEKPFSTIEDAQAYIRSIPRNSRNGIKVFIKGGVYPINKTVEFDEEDSGIKGSPIVYTSYEGEAVLSGMTKVDTSEAAVVTDTAILERLPQAARGKVIGINLAVQGLSGLGEVYDKYMFQSHNKSAEIIWNGVPLTKSRWPNAGEWANVNEYMTTGTPHYTLPPAIGDEGISFTIKNPSANFAKWSYATNAVLVGSWSHDWAVDYLKLDYADSESGVVKSRTSPSYAAGGSLSSNCFYIENLMEEIDVPGEWYIENDILYIYPPSELTENTIIEIPTLGENMFTFKNVKNINFENLTLYGGKNGGISVSGSENCNFSGLTVSNFYNSAIALYKTKNCGVYSSDISYMGERGIVLEEDSEARKTLISNGNVIKNNKISNTGRQFIMDSYACGIYLTNATGAYVSHNEVFDMPYTGIWYTGNNNVIEYNDIHDVVKEVGDGGAIYAGQKFIDQGNEINFNYIHSIKQNPSRKNSTLVAVYLDDMESGTMVFGNIINGAQTGIILGGGKNTTIKNNIIMNSLTTVGTGDYSISADSRGTGWASSSVPGYAEDAKAWWANSAWQSQYPWMASNYFDSMQGYPAGNDISNNIIYNHKDTNISSEHSKYGTVNKNIKYTTLYKWYYGDIFVDEDNGNLNLNPNKGAFKVITDFKNIPFDDIGLYADDYRK